MKSTKFISALLALSALLIPSQAFPAKSEAEKASQVFKNLLTNPGFEASTAAWAASGGTVAPAKTAGNIGTGNASGLFTASAASQTLTSGAVVIPGGLLGKNGRAYCSFKTSNTDFVIQAYDGSNILAEQTIPATTSSVPFQKAGVNFIFPSSGSVSVRVVSASAGTVYVDDCYMGLADNLTEVSQATYVARAKIVGTSSCLWSSSGTTLADFPAVAACPGVTVEYQSGIGTVDTTDYNLPQLPMLNLPAGEYEASVTFVTQGSTATNYDNNFALSDGTTVSGVVTHVANNAGLKSVTVTGRFPHLTAGNKTFKILGSASTGTADIYTNYQYRDMTFTLKRYPLASELALKPDQANWRVSANIYGANPALGTAELTSYTGIENGSLTLVNNSISGGLAAQIPCSGTNSPSGTTCSSGNESLGVSFNVSSTDTVQACATFTHQESTNCSNVYQIVETGNNSQTILQEGKERIHSGKFGGADSIHTPVKVCGKFDIASIGQKTFRLMRTQSACTTGAVILGDRALGNRDIHWEVEPVTRSTQLQIANQVQTSNSGGERVERLKVTFSSGTPTISSQSGDWVSSITDVGTGQFTLNLPTGKFSDVPTCVCTAGDAQGVCHFPKEGTTPTTTSLTFGITDGATSFGWADVPASIMCMGPR